MSVILAPQVTVFERIPDVFVEAYDAGFRWWAANFGKVGTTAVMKLRKPLEPSALSTDRRRIVGVRLTAEVQRGLGGKVTRIVIRPQDEANEEAIRRHSAELRAGLH